MNKKSIWYNWSLWLLIAMNLYAIYFYGNNPNSISTIMAVFWMQSVFIGVFNALGMLSFTNRVPNSFTVNDKPNNSPGCAAAFFTVHYGFFHFAYAIFLAIQLHVEHMDWLFLKLSFYTILLSCILQFIQDKNHNQTAAVNIGTMFFMPYARIIPMHLAILLPAFLHIPIGIVFLLLKMLADIIMYVIYRKYMFRAIEQES